jgi:hypothetical protein
MDERCMSCNALLQRPRDKQNEPPICAACVAHRDPDKKVR